jgi:2-phosphosulfolactate phosphatase
MTIYGQDGYGVRLEWGPDGVRELGPGCAVLIILDVLVFTTSVDVAVGRGARVLPLPWRDERADEAARRAGAILTRSGLVRQEVGFVADDDAPPWTLRPSSLVTVPEGTFLAIASPNGATLSAAAADTGATVLAGCLRNASVVAAAARKLAGDNPIGVVPAGERWHSTPSSQPTQVASAAEANAGTRPTEVRGLRPSLEEYLGAGAVVSALGPADRSPEAEVAALAFESARDRLPELLMDCVSGRELVKAGLPVDVELAMDLDASDTVPILLDGVFERWVG